MRQMWMVVVAGLALTPPTQAQQAATATTPLVGGNPRVSPDGSRILFGSDRSGRAQLYAMRSDGSDVRQLTSDSGGAFSPNWSPDGKRVVYATSRGGEDLVVVINADGTQRRVVGAAKGSQTPAWSPTGTKILFTAGDFPNLYIQTMNVDGTDRHKVLAEPGFNYDAVFSPDGKAIAFVSGIPGQGVRVFVMNADGSARRRLTTNDLNEERPAWSSDGQQLAIQASTRRGQGPAEAYIHIVDPRSGVDRRLGQHDRPQLDETPSWFPHAKRLAIQSDRDGTWSVYVIGLDGATLARLTSR